MIVTLAERVKWFARNLKAQIEDISLEKRGIAIDLYFDTMDVTRALLGLEDLFSPNKGFDLKEFRGDKTLVQCLAGSGRLGQLQLLPPHQFEFLNLLNSEFHRMGRKPGEHAHEFLNQIQAAGAIKGQPSKLEPDNIVAFVREHGSSAVDIFKAVQCMRGVNWKKRLAQWRATGSLRFSPFDDYSELLRSPRLQSLKKSFDRRRPDLAVNNFADAVAIEQLIMLLERYNSEPEDAHKRLPRFFVSSNLYQEVITEAESISLLQYRTDQGPSSVLRKDEYFKFKAMFRNLKGNPSSDDLDSELSSLQELYKQVDQILQAQEPLTDAAVDVINFADRPLTKVIKELEDLTFFENVWLPFSAEEEAQDALKEFGEAIQQFESGSVEGAVVQAIGETKQALEANVNGYKLVSSLWTSLEGASASLQTSLKKDPSRPLNVLWDLGLLRFDFPLTAQTRIKDAIEALFSNDEEAQKAGRIAVITAYYSYARNDQAKKEGDLALAAAVLWVAKMDWELIRLLDDLIYDCHYSLKLVYVASVFRSNCDQKMSRARNVMDSLAREFSETTDKQKRMGLAVGLAYLNFHLRSLLGFSPAWRPQAESPPKASREVGERLLSEAISFTSQAFKMSRDVDMQKHVYALNQYLYYLVEAAPDSEGDRMKGLANLLGNFKNHAELWQYRFDDTLARHFHRLAMFVREPSKKLDLMDMAKRHIESACLGPYKDENVEIYRTEFDLQYAHLIVVS